MKTFEFIGEKQDFRTSEAYKTLRTNITFCGDDVKVIAVTSCTPNEGKSTLSRNLSIHLAETGKRVLYLDADLRKSVAASQIVSDSEIIGLSYLLSGQAELGDVIYQSGRKNLNAIFAGSYPPNPAELLGSKRFKTLISRMRESFDYIIIDTPPLGSVIDCAVMAPVCDGVVLVVRAGRISYKLARNVKLQIEKTGCRILGAVLNGVAEKEKSSYYYSDYYVPSEKKKRKR